MHLLRFCADCVADTLHNVCPNCGGGFSPRPIRPARNWKGDNDTTHFPPSPKGKHRPVDVTTHEIFAGPIRGMPVARR